MTTQRNSGVTTKNLLASSVNKLAEIIASISIFRYEGGGSLLLPSIKEIGDLIDAITRQTRKRKDKKAWQSENITEVVNEVKKLIDDGLRDQLIANVREAVKKKLKAYKSPTPSNGTKPSG
ncbi:hypothetical protein KKA15_00480 [Patescibacteria group bacterium]|nr:hypothetical protein [Patescibacteria group bacterium]